MRDKRQGSAGVRREQAGGRGSGDAVSRAELNESMLSFSSRLETSLSNTLQEALHKAYEGGAQQNSSFTGPPSFPHAPQQQTSSFTGPPSFPQVPQQHNRSFVAPPAFPQGAPQQSPYLTSAAGGGAPALAVGVTPTPMAHGYVGSHGRGFVSGAASAGAGVGLTTSGVGPGGAAPGAAPPAAAPTAQRRMDGGAPVAQKVAGPSSVSLPSFRDKAGLQGVGGPSASDTGAVAEETPRGSGACGGDDGRGQRSSGRQRGGYAAPTASSLSRTQAARHGLK